MRESLKLRFWFRSNNRYISFITYLIKIVQFEVEITNIMGFWFSVTFYGESFPYFYQQHKLKTHKNKIHIILVNKGLIPVIFSFRYKKNESWNRMGNGS